MIIALYCVAAAMVLGGVYSAFAGWEIIILERGWTQVLSGVIIATGGVILVGIAFLAGELRKLLAGLRAQAVSGKPAMPRADSARAEAGFEQSPSDSTSSGAPLAGATAVALTGFDKVKGAFTSTTQKGEADRTSALSSDAGGLQTAPAEMDGAPPVPQPDPADMVLSRAAEAEAQGDAREEEIAQATDPFAPRTRPEAGVGHDPSQVTPGDEEPRSEGGLRDAVADALFADEIPRAMAPQEPASAQPAGQETDSQEPGDQEPGDQEPDHHEPDVREPRDTEQPAHARFTDTARPTPDAPDPAFLVPEATEPVSLEEHLPEASATDTPGDDWLAHPPSADDVSQMSVEPAAQEPPGESAASHEAAVSYEQERFAALLQAQTATDEPDPAPALPDPEPEIAPEPPLPAATAPEPEQVAPVVPETQQQEPAADPASQLGIIGTYESGGNTYTMYADGSIDAKTPEGDYHFTSLDELKTFIAEGGENRGA